MNTTFTLRFQTDAASAAAADFLDASADIRCRDFGGRTRFVIARRDVAAFAADVTALRRGDADLAQLLGGWDAAEERLRLRVTRAGTAELFAVRVRVADADGSSGQWDRVETQFVCTARALTEFLGGVERVGSAGTPGEATLRGDSNPAG